MEDIGECVIYLLIQNACAALVFNLVNELNVADMNARIEQFQSDNLKVIQKNRFDHLTRRINLFRATSINDSPADLSSWNLKLWLR